MGDAKARGTFAQRKAQAIAAGRVKTEKKRSAVVMPTTRELFLGFMRAFAPVTKTPTPIASTENEKKGVSNHV